MSNKVIARHSAIGLMLSFLLLFYGSLQAQTLSSNYGSPGTPLQVANGTAIFKIRITGTGTGCTGPSTLNITLPSGYIYISNSAGVTAGSGSVSQTSASNNTATLSVSSIPGIGDSTIISYQVYAGCGVIGGSNTTVNYELNSCTGITTAIANISAQNAQLNITNITNGAFVGNVEQSYTRTITVTNNGNGTIDTIYLDSKNGLGFTIVSGTSNTGTIALTKTWTATDTTYRYRIAAPTADGHLANGESVVITEVVKITGCSGMTTNFKAWYGPGGTECSVISNTSTAGATINSGIQPQIVVSLISQPDLKCLPTGPSSGWVVFQLKNNGAVPALMNEIRNYAGNSSSHATAGPVAVSTAFGAGGNTCSGRTMFTDTAAGIEYSFDGGVTWSTGTYTVYQCYNAWPAGGGYHDGKPISLSFKSAIPQLASGDSVRIRFKIHDEIPPCCNGDWYQSYYSMSASYTDLCGNNLVSSNSVSTGSYTAQRYSLANTSPLDAIGGQPYYLGFSGFIINSNNSYRTSNDGYIDYEITLPTSLVPSLATSDHPLTKGSLTKYPDVVTWDGINRKLRLRFLRSNLISTDYNTWNLSVKTTADCAGTGGVATMNTFVKLSACAAEEWQASCNVTAPFTVHACGVTGCSGPLNFATTVQRTNYGIYSGGNNGLPGGVTDTSMLNLEGTIYGDTVAVTTRSKISGTNSYSNMYVSITKSEADAVHPFIDATAYIYNNGSLTATITGIGAGTVTGTNPSTRTLSISGTGSPALFVPNDSVVVVTRFKQLIDSDKKVDFTTTMYASNSAVATGLPQFSCDGNWTGTIFCYAAGIGGPGYSAVNMTACNPAVPQNYLAYQIMPSSPGASRHYKFPNEIRQLWAFDSLTVVIPAGFEVTNLNVFLTGQSTVANTGIASLAPSSINTATNTYYYDISTLSDQFIAAGVPFSEGLSFYVRPTIVAKCKSANFNNLIGTFRIHSQKVPTGTWTWNNQGFYLNSIDNSFAPLNTTSPAPNQTINSNNVSWEIQVTNPTGVTKTKAWIAEATGINGVTITSVSSLSGPGGTVSGTVSAVNGIYQLGDIPGTTSRYYRINGSFANCVTDSIKLVYDFACDAYPSGVAAGEAGCRAKLLPLIVNVQTAALQLAKITEPGNVVNLCDNLNYELEVTNSGLGSATGLSVKVQLPATAGVQYVAGSYGFKYPATAGNYTSLPDGNVTVNGTVVTFNIPATALSALPGTEKYRIRFQMSTQACAYTSGEKLVFMPAGTNACGTNIQGSAVASNRININGVPSILPVFAISSRADSLTVCGSGAVTTNYRFKIIKISSGSPQTDTTSGFRISIPAPFTMNTNVTYLHGSATYNNSPAAGVYDFKINAGLAVGDSIVFQTTLSTPAAGLLTCGASGTIVESGFVTFSATCSSQPATICSTKQLLEPENAASTIFVKRPAYTIAAFTAAAAGNPPNHLTGSFTLNHTNSVYTPQNGTLKVYKDVNANGIQDAGDIFIGSQVYAIANAASQVFAYDIIATAGMTDACPVIAVLELSCSCIQPFFSYTCSGIVLPVRFAEEKATAEGCTVRLSWNYEASDVFVTGFLIERNKGNNKWETVARMEEQERSFTDVTPNAGQWLYRIKAMNTANELVYSKIINITTNCKGTAMLVFPNPAKDQLYIALQGYKEQDVPYNITDKLGRLVQQGNIKGDRRNTIDVSTLAAGMYHIHIIYGGSTFVEKLDIVK